MAAVDNAFGFIPIDSDGKQARIREYPAASGTVLYPGDPVKFDSDGEIVAAAAGDQLCGICAEYKASGSAKLKAKVYDDKDQEFVCQSDGTYAASHAGLNINFVTAAPDTTLLRSKDEAQQSSAATTANLPFKIIGLYERGENAVGANANIVVKMNQHTSSDGTAGV